MCICYPEKLNPADFGWGIDKYQKNEIRWSFLKSAPDAVLEVISCGCKTGTCTTSRFQWHRHKLKCSDVYGCQNCSNQFEKDENAITDSGSNSESGAESNKFESGSEIQQKCGRS